MKQIAQSFSDGQVTLLEVPDPQVRPGHLLIQSTCSLVSVGTERMLIQFGRASTLDKARQQPERVKMVLDKIKTDGLLTTVEAVQTKLSHPIPLGYANAGRVLAVGKGVEGFQVGDRVVSNGPHAEKVCVPTNLCAHIPDEVSDEEAAFTVVASVGLQGIRLAQPTLGESFLVVGLGLIGLLTAQMLKAHGVRVIGADINETRCKLAQEFGIETINPSTVPNAAAYIQSWSNEKGVDGAIITASTKNSAPIDLSAQACRRKGRIVLVGVAEISLDRTVFYNKELSFQVSCSYGPGRYDSSYEQRGHDYPFEYVRWTEQRNFQAVLNLMDQKSLNTLRLVEHRIPFSSAQNAYTDEVLKSGLGVLLKYDGSSAENTTTVKLPEAVSRKHLDTNVTVGLIGAGNYTAQVLIKNLAASNTRLKTICSAGGLNATLLGTKHGFEKASTQVEDIFKDPDINTVVISVRHDLHVPYAIRALQEGKNVFVEKPLALNSTQLLELQAFYESLPKETRPLLMVGFNRRFAPLIAEMKRLLNAQRAPKQILITVNAGSIPADHWTQDLNSGGGRLIGEGCHFIDLARYLAAEPIVKNSVESLPSTLPLPDSLSCRLRFADGSIATILYLSNGAKSFPKERVEVFCNGVVLQLDNFRKLRVFGWKGNTGKSLWKQDKGHLQTWQHFVKAIHDGTTPISFKEMAEVTQCTFDLHEQIVGKRDVTTISSEQPGFLEGPQLSS